MIDKIKKIDQKGGNLTGTLIKIKIETIKKINKLYDTLEDQLKNKIDNFDYVYIHTLGLNVIGLHLIKKEATNYIQIFSTINDYNSLDYLRNQLTQKGNIVVGIDMSGFISNKDQKIIDFVLKN